MSVRWDGDDRVVRNMAVYGERVRQAVRAVADYWAPVIEAYAKDNAAWTDRTGNARQSLHAFVEQLSRDSVALYLAHGVEYGKWLELAHAGRYAIILPALQAHYGPIGEMLRGMFR